MSRVELRLWMKDIPRWQQYRRWHQRCVLKPAREACGNIRGRDDVTSVAATSRQNTPTRPPPPPPPASAYSSRAVRHNVPSPALLLGPVLMLYACMCILITSNRNVPNQPMIPAALPERSGAHEHGFVRESASATWSSTSAGSAWCAGLDGMKRHSVPSYFWGV